MTRLKLLSRAGCHLCEDLRRQVDEILADEPHTWEVVDVDAHPDLRAEFSEQVPVLYVDGRLFARGRLPPIAPRLRLQRAIRRGRSGI